MGKGGRQKGGKGIVSRLKPPWHFDISKKNVNKLSTLFPPDTLSGVENYLFINNKLYVPTKGFTVPHFPPPMTHTIINHLIPTCEQQEDKKIITISDEGGEHLGLLYYEITKRGFVNKPLSLNRWGLVDAKIERLYEKYPEIEPIDILQWGSQLANPQR